METSQDSTGDAVVNLDFKFRDNFLVPSFSMSVSLSPSVLLPLCAEQICFLPAEENSCGAVFEVV